MDSAGFLNVVVARAEDTCSANGFVDDFAVVYTVGDGNVANKVAEDTGGLTLAALNGAVVYTVCNSCVGIGRQSLIASETADDTCTIAGGFKVAVATSS